MNSVSATGGGAIGVAGPDASVVVKNSILWNNTAPVDNSIHNGDGGTASAQYSLIQDDACPTNVNCGGGMVYSQDPSFADLGTGNVHLLSNSPAIDGGNDADNSTTTDLDGNPRKFDAYTGGNMIDMGAYEFNGCAAPVITEVTNISSSRATAHWIPVATAGSYITRRYAAGTTDYVYAGYKKPITDTLRRLRNMKPGKQYFVQVKSICAGGTDSSDWSAPFEFTTLSDCHAPTGLSVTSVTATAATLNWTPPVSSPVSLQLSNRVVGTTKWNTRYVSATDISKTINNLLPSSEYEWRIRSICSDDTSHWAIGANFTTAAASAATRTSLSNTESYGLKAVVMPNPNKGNFTIQMQLPKDNAATTLQLFNNLGANIWQADMGVVSGSISKNIYLENKLPSGVYMLMIRRGDIHYTTKVVVSK